ncbi:caM kinase-like vesicle-associated protein isoform X2 [Syngnathus typhle]|uniref:caM kinase-like vesicle-associated protein isoform X2 n=1 Tax=Syngnathus typhle TaxID=161592 RepID=UPI002A6B2167|nr:caM kinase-like vesicle-associated protein isoform X2 [Syngnathus typhle]
MLWLSKVVHRKSQEFLCTETTKVYDMVTFFQRTTRRSGVAMPFGCLTIGEKKDYHSPSEVTDKYDMGQIVKSEEFCEVFRAKDKNTMRMYTCKKFLKKDGRKVRKTAKNEILILKMVKHPNILQLVDVFETKKEYYIFLELATGREVFDWILDQGYYSERDTSNVVRQVLEAVAYLHSLQIVHRNLKLENLVYYNRLKHSKIVISDFHLAKLENGLIKDPCGTPEYLAPEVVGRQRYGRPVDCWATGVIMYILLSGNPPFYDESDEDDYENHDKNLFRKILAGDYEFDSPYWDEISDSAKSLVSRLMEVDQEQRLTAQEAINHEWISGGAASDKNIKEHVCAQIEKNFARAKWKKAVRVTTIMKRLRPTEQSNSKASSPAASAAEDPAASPEADADPSAPSPAAAAPPQTVTEINVLVPESVDGAEPPPQEAEPTSGCNGDTVAPLHGGNDAEDEQG